MPQMPAVPAEGRGAFRWPRVEVHAGAGVVHRSADALLVIPHLAVAHREHAAEMVRLAGEGPDPGGSRRVRRLAWMVTDSEPADVPDFALLVEGGTSLRLMVRGEVTVEVTGPQTLSLSGRDSLAWVERLLPEAFRTITVHAPEEDVRGDVALPRYDLRAGTVPGAGVTLHGQGAAEEGSPHDGSGRRAAGIPVPAERAPEQVHESPARELVRPVASPQGEAHSATVVRPPGAVRRVVLAHGEDRVPAPHRDPLPILSGGAAGGDAPTADVVTVEGVVCRCGQFNDPGADACVVCGRPLEEPRRLTTRPRPPLGLLITDDGRVFPLAADVVIGRDPQQASDVRSGRARPVVLTDAEHSTSRVHAHIGLSGWRVVARDCGSANGTFLSHDGPGGPWTPLGERDTPLRAGDRLRLGTRRHVLYDRYQMARAVTP